MNDQWTNRLSEYLDGELDQEQRVALDAHLSGCAACRATLEQLRRVVVRAKSLEDRRPERDLWPDIADQIRAGNVAGRPSVRPSVRRFTFSVPQLLAASIALMVLAGGSVWLALQGRDEPNVAVTSPAAPTTKIVPASDRRWAVQTDLAVAELEEALARNEGQLDTATVRVLRQSLASIDRAIAQAQRALRRDPGNAYLNLHLADKMRQKIELLRRANALAVSES